MLRPLLRDFDTVLGRAIPKQVGPLRLMSSYIEAVLDEPAPPTAELSQLITAHIYDLAALTMGATRDAAELASSRGVRAARLRAIKSDVRANLHRDDLSIEQVARSHRVSPRYVQMLFAEEALRSQSLCSTDVSRAHRMLTNPWFADRSISRIAFEVGFNDLSYFNKTFRRRFESTPSDVRAATGGVPASSRA
jgi:AraC-like DNA-binding protein